MASRKIVLFLCNENSARSQMAEALLRHLAGDRFEAHSAGLRPTEVHPITLQVLREIGVETSGLFAKSLALYLGKMRVDHAVIVCETAQKDCPHLYPFALNVQNWPFDDPAAGEDSAGEQLARFREARDRIKARIQHWIEETVPG